MCFEFLSYNFNIVMSFECSVVSLKIVQNYRKLRIGIPELAFINLYDALYQLYNLH